MDADEGLFVKCAGGLLTLDLALKYAMTELRLRGAKGEGDSFSFFEKLSKVQLLTAEYVPVLILVMGLNLYKRKPLSSRVRYLFVACTLSRYLFALRAVDFSVNSKGYAGGTPGTGIPSLSPFGVVGAGLSYAAYAGLLATLFLE